MRRRNISKSEVQSPMSNIQSHFASLTLDIGHWTKVLVDLAEGRDLIGDFALVADDNESHLVSEQISLRDSLHVLGRDGEDLLHVSCQIFIVQSMQIYERE